MLYYFTIRFYEEEINGCKICYSEKRGAWNHIEICNTIEINVQALPGSTGACYELFLSLD
jgi:hypothetical protein